MMVRIEETLAYARTIVDLVHQPLAVLDRELRVRYANPAFQRLFPMAGNSRVDELLQMPQLADVLVHGAIPRHELTRGERQLVIDARRLDAPSGHLDSILVAVEDVTARREAERALRHQ